MKLLLITSSFPPYNDSQTIRLVQLIASISGTDFEWKIIVPGTVEKDFYTNEMIRSLPMQTTVHRTPLTFYHRYLIKVNSVNKKLGWLYKNLMYYLSYPDLFRGWDKQVLALYKEELETWHPDIVISSSGSNTAHLAALSLKLNYNIPWIADFGDPWSIIDKKFRPWFYLISKQKERRVFENCNKVIFTTEETLIAYDKIYSSTLNGDFIYYGFSIVDFEGLSYRNIGSELSLSHIGAAYFGDRNLVPTIKAINELNKAGDIRFSLNLQIIGNHSHKFESVAKELGMYVNFKDRVSYNDSLEYIKNADILILVGNKGKLQIPGKVFHYIASCNPIVYIYQQNLEDDPAAILLAQFGGVVFVKNDENEIQTAVRNTIKEFDKLKKDAFNRNMNVNFNKLESKEISNRFLKLIKEVISR